MKKTYTQCKCKNMYVYDNYQALTGKAIDLTRG